jgi:hypothetical protein
MAGLSLALEPLVEKLFDNLGYPTVKGGHVPGPVDVRREAPVVGADQPVIELSPITKSTSTRGSANLSISRSGAATPVGPCCEYRTNPEPGRGRAHRLTRMRPSCLRPVLATPTHRARRLTHSLVSTSTVTLPSTLDAPCSKQSSRRLCRSRQAARPMTRTFQPPVRYSATRRGTRRAHWQTSAASLCPGMVRLADKNIATVRAIGATEFNHHPDANCSDHWSQGDGGGAIPDVYRPKRASLTDRA